MPYVKPLRVLGLAGEGGIERGAVLPAAPDDPDPGAGRHPDGVRADGQPRPVAAA